MLVQADELHRRQHPSAGEAFATSGRVSAVS
jgi:hypothetical protein